LYPPSTLKNNLRKTAFLYPVHARFAPIFGIEKRIYKMILKAAIWASKYNSLIILASR
jgi:hypothetical protein